MKMHFFRKIHYKSEHFLRKVPQRRSLIEICSLKKQNLKQTEYELLSPSARHFILNDVGPLEMDRSLNITRESFDKNFYIMGHLLWCLGGHSELFGINIFQPLVCNFEVKRHWKRTGALNRRARSRVRERRENDNGGYGSGTPLRSHFRICATQSDEKAWRRENARWILNVLAEDLSEEPRTETLLISATDLPSLPVEDWGAIFPR